MCFADWHKWLCLVLLLNVASTAVATEAFIPTVKDIRILKQQAEQSEMPVLLLFTSEDCEFCEAIRQNYLLPMMRSSDYRDAILFRQLYMDEFRLMRNDQGRLVGGDQLALDFKVSVSPTILFLDANGHEVAERIVGVSGADYFDKTLQLHISQATQSMLN